MLKKIRSKKNFLFSLFAAVFITFSFQNCGQNMTALNSTTTASTSATSTTTTTTSLLPCVAAGCLQAISYIQLEISNNNPISFLASGSSVAEPAVDVSGYCNAGGYPATRIYYSIQDNAGNIVVPTSASTGACDNLGKFHFPVTISALSGSNNYLINVVLRAVDSTGIEFDNQLGLNKRQVGLSPRTGI